MPIVIIFDLDGTLINVSEYHAASIETAVRETWRVENPLSIRERAGLPQRSTLEKIADLVESNAATRQTDISRAMGIMTSEMDKSLPEDLSSFVLPGVKDLLSELSTKTKIFLTLATGTLGPTAKIILDRSKLIGFFPVGAYGHEVITRHDLVRLSRSRAEEYYQLQGSESHVLTIGDAISDIKAGKEIDALTVGVATGWFSMEELKRNNPHLVLESFLNTEECMQAILSLAPSK